MWVIFTFAKMFPGCPPFFFMSNPADLHDGDESVSPGEDAGESSPHTEPKRCVGPFQTVFNFTILVSVHTWTHRSLHACSYHAWQMSAAHLTELTVYTSGVFFGAFLELAPRWLCAKLKLNKVFRITAVEAARVRGWLHVVFEHQRDKMILNESTYLQLTGCLPLIFLLLDLHQAE